MWKQTCKYNEDFDNDDCDDLHSSSEIKGLLKTVEVLGETNDSLTSTVDWKSALRRILENQWYSSKIKYSQGKLRLYTSLKERPGIETYLILNNPKLWQAITKLRINAHKLPIETGRYDQKTQMERICPLCCEGISNETHHIFECQSKEMIKVWNECLEPFHKNWKILDKLSTENFCRAILSGQNDDLFYPETLKYWVGVQRSLSYLMGRRCLFSLGWRSF